MGIRIRSLDGGADDFYTGAGGDGFEMRTILTVVVTDEEAGMLAPGGGLTELLRHPGICGMGGDSGVHGSCVRTPQ